MRALPLTAGSIVAALCLSACDSTGPNDDGNLGGASKTAHTITVAPTRLTFRVYALVPRNDPSTQSIAIGSLGGASLVWSASTNAGWISLSHAGGQAPGGLLVSVSRGRLPLGYRPATLTGTITVSSAGANQIQIPVSVLISYLPPIKVAPATPDCGQKCD